MPKAIHDALMKVAGKYAKQGKLRGAKGKGKKAVKKAKNRFVFGTMANMKKRGEY